MKALWTAILYFGSFLTLGLAAKIALGRWARRRDVDLTSIQAQAGANRRARRLFLLGAWRTED